jgi:hypothetical protein
VTAMHEGNSKTVIGSSALTTGPGGDVMDIAARPAYSDNAPDACPGVYPVPGRSPEMNRRIAAHECGHCLAARALGTNVHFVSIIRDGKYEGVCVRSGPTSEHAFSSDLETKTNNILSLCERLQRLSPPELGSARVADSEYYVRLQCNLIELVAAECAELILHPDLPPLGAANDLAEAHAVAGIAVAGQPAVASLLSYCRAEAQALLQGNVDILRALVEALIDRGTLTGDQVDAVISHEVAMRSLRLEHQRRADWKRRQQSAALLVATPSTGAAANHV